MSLLSLLRGSSSEARNIGPYDIPWSNREASTSWVTEISAYNLSSVWACQTLIADAIATLPINTYRKAGDVRTETPQPAWIAKPNPEWNRIEFDIQRILSLLGWGNAYTLLIRRSGSHDPMDPVIERWILNPAHMVVTRRHNPTDVTDEIAYHYLGQHVPTENVQHIRGYVVPGWWLGMSPIANMNRGLITSIESQTAGLNFYAQGMMLGGVLEVPNLPADTSEEVVESLRDQFSSRHAGAGNAGKPAVLLGGTKWNGTGVSPTDGLLLETRRFELNEVCRWYRVPPHKVSDIVQHASQGGGKGVEQQAAEFAQDCLMPWTARLEEADSALLPRGQYLKYNIDASIRPDAATRSTLDVESVLNGIENYDEIRARRDLPPRADGLGDLYLMPANTVNAAAAPTEPPAPVVVAPPAPSAPPVEPPAPGPPDPNPGDA